MEESGGSGVMVGYPSGGEDSSSSSSSSPSASATHEDGTPGTASLSGPASGSPAGTTAIATTTTAAADPKKLRACEACRGLKVRCEPDPREGRPCKRCSKAGRPCVVTAPTRRRQRKTDSRVSELEKKIDALTASLQARTNSGSGSGGSGGGGGGGLHRQDETTTTTTTTPPATATTTTGRLHGKGQEHRDWDVEVTPWDSNRPADQDSHFQQLITMAGRKRKAMEDADQQQQQGEGSGRGARPQTHHGAATRKDTAAAAAAAAADDDDRRPSAAAASVGWPAYTSRAADGDVVERGLVPPALAARLLSRYNAQMVRHLPGVVFAPGTGVAELRAARPVLFLAVMAAAAGEDHALQRVLQRELMHVLAARVLVTGEKSLELVQALNVAVIWYWPPEYFEELKFYQLIHVAAVMAIDIGLGRRTNGRARAAASSSFSGAGGMGMGMGGMGGGGMGGGGMGGGWGSFRGGGRAAAPPDPTSLEARRTWLTCYYLASNTAMSLHRPHLIRWTSFMADSMRILETSPDAAPTDRYFCHLVWTHHLGEQIGAQLSMDDPDAAGAGAGAGAGVDIADPRTQYALRALERDLERYRAGVPPERMHATLKIAFDLLNLYMHETVLHADHFGEPPSADDDDNNDNNSNNKNGPGVHQQQQQQQQRKQQPLSAQHINALTSCLAAINGIFTTFLGMDVESIRCLPVFNFVRVAYAVVVLMKMYFSAEPPPPPPPPSGSSGASTTTTTGGPAGASWSADFGAVFTRDSMRVRQHLDALLDKFRETAAGDRCRPASKFLVVLAMLRSWFVKQGSAAGSSGGGGTESARQGAQATGGVGGGDGITGSTAQQQRQQSQPQQQQQHLTMQTPTASTPLHLLSEVATGSDPTNPGAAPSPFGYYRSTAPAPVPSFFPDANGGASFNTTSGNNSSSNGSSSSTGLYPPWIAEAMMSSSSSSAAAAAVEGGGVSFDGSDFPTAMMGIGGGIEGFDGARAATTNDQFWTDMFQGIPDPNMFTF